MYFKISYFTHRLMSAVQFKLLIKHRHLSTFVDRNKLNSTRRAVDYIRIVFEPLIEQK